MKFRIPALLFCSFVQSLWAIPSFPGAEGWGAAATGGRGGKVYIVTNTNASGAGSFSQALMAAEPRIIVFRVSGVINSAGPEYGSYLLRAAQNNLTIAGQTSPGGVTLRGTGESYWFSYQGAVQNFIFRFLGRHALCLIVAHHIIPRCCYHWIEAKVPYHQVGKER